MSEQISVSQTERGAIEWGGCAVSVQYPWRVRAFGMPVWLAAIVTPRRVYFDPFTGEIEICSDPAIPALPTFLTWWERLCTRKR